MISTPNTGATIMANNNNVILRGNLGKDPARYQDKKGNGYVILSLCTQDSYQDEQSQEWKTLPEVWHTVFAFGKTAAIANSFKKGERIEVSGRLSYQTTKVMIDGETRHFTEATITAWSIKDARLRKKVNQPTTPEAA
jgi:single-stranded DNA-binding protein